VWEAGPQATAGGPEAAGCLLIIGGSERLDKHLRLLHTYAHLCDQVPGRRSLVIITTATGHPEILGGEYVRIFGQIGWPAHAIHMPALATRADAADPGTAALIAGAAGLFMTGGDQVTLVDVLRGTPAGDALVAAYRTGAVVAGTSAGATAIGDPMIARGGGTGELRQGMIALHPGLALAGPEIIIDTHFSQRGRFPRLVGAIAEHPTALGVGLDENTALLVAGGQRQAAVLGAGVVYFIDSPDAHPPSVAQGGALSLAPLTLHILHEGQRYDLATRALVSPP
jgi:cyanophycinase